MEQDIRPNGTLRNAIGIEAPPDIGNWRTAHDFAKQTLRRAILRGELPGGTRLIQSDLATQLGVSTTPVREALRDLAGGGLITLDRNRGGVVRELNWHEVEEIDQIQERLRPLAMELAVRNISDAELRKADALADQMDQERIWRVGWIATFAFTSCFMRRVAEGT